MFGFRFQLITLEILVMCLSVYEAGPHELVGQPIKTIINHRDDIGYFGRNRGQVTNVVDHFGYKRGHVNKNNLISISSIDIIEPRQKKSNNSSVPRMKNAVNFSNLIQISKKRN